MTTTEPSLFTVTEFITRQHEAADPDAIDHVSRSMFARMGAGLPARDATVRFTWARERVKRNAVTGEERTDVPDGVSGWVDLGLRVTLTARVLP